ncbi:MAG: universal stress protein [Candidatus Rokubacteria bacterium]|nr:universal stress protein [Candidatus Rokubacteria bacterium]MBI2014171.1 universal stress protein [Candidatus Rokubacteria bacterium]MBI2155606.1 universal stress protein [Candidatus Rokubacteria bacterium]MBI4253435.1 universal stress protein [Candidatus Rokubacteria bacterium]
MSRRVLHPTDFSTASAAAFAKAVEMAKAGRGELLLVHVMNPVIPVPGDGYISPKVYDEIAASTKAWGQKQLAKRLAKAKAAGVRARGFLLEGVPHEQIVRIAKSRRADLVVMGTHGRSGLAKLFLGSVAGRVVAASPCPVLTVRGR